VTTGPAAAARGALETLLTDAAVGGRRRFLPAGAAARTIAGLTRRPRRPVARATALGTELTRAAIGRSQLRPARTDRRFADHAWETNPLLRGLLQAYLAAGDAVDGLITDAELDWRDERQARFAAGNVLDALAPTNFPWTNPAVIKETVDHGGRNLARGARQFARDITRSPRLPASVDTIGFSVGDNLAASPGAVVLRTDVFELIQYRPRTPEVHEVPMLIVPPTINKFYVLDLAPGRSLVEHLLGEGQQVFAISWRNPCSEHGHWDLDTYAEAILQARAATAEIARSGSVHLTAACSGGIIGAGALAHLAAEGASGEVASITLLVCALDNARAGTASALAGREVAAAAIAESARKGYLDGRSLAGMFAWLRPNDLIWSYVVNNYLMGRRPPAFDILYWNQDTVRMTAGLHRDFVRIALENSLTRANGLTVLGSPVDLGAVRQDAYVVAGLHDHLVPWENAYRSAQLLGGETRFVLSTSGHIQALVNPPIAESRSSFRTAGERATPEAWLDAAATSRGSWWPDWTAWLDERSGGLRAAPSKLGSRAHKAAGRAPGSYVHAA
jgi:poly[(R)-3-hydroxyalkanoate] polymerase subunit PhaC